MLTNVNRSLSECERVYVLASANHGRDGGCIHTHYNANDTLYIHYDANDTIYILNMKHTIQI